MQFELPGMPVPLYPASPNRLSTWAGCPRRYRFTYLDRPPPPRGAPWAHNSLGAAVHSALADWFVLPRARRVPEAARGLLRRRWLNDGFRDPSQAGAVGNLAVAWMEKYCAAQDPGDEPVGVERGVAASTATTALSGRIDRLDDRDGELVVVDYKTGRHVPSPADAGDSLALAVYAFAAGKTLRRRATRVELHHLPSATVAAWSHTPSGLAAALAGADGLAAGCARADAAFATGDTEAPSPPRTSSGCSWCDFRRACPEGRAAAPDRPSWAGLPDGGEL